MSHENSAEIIQRELASEYGRGVISNGNRGFMGVLVKLLVIPLIAMLVIFIGSSFAIANFSPALYTQAKDIIFENVDLEKLTGQTDLINREYLDNWLIFNSEKQLGEEVAQEGNAQEELIAQEGNVQEEQTKTPLN